LIRDQHRAVKHTIRFFKAFVLAALIARTIARPLQHFASAAQSIARGHYEQRVPEEGAAEVRAAAEAFNAMSAEVQATQQAQRDFLANVSHDLKTPLTSIQGYAQAIMDGASKDPAQSATIIYDEATRLSRMVAELTDLARLQAGGVTMRNDPVDLVPLWEALKQRMDVVAERKRLTVTLNLPKSAVIEGDGDRLAQVFMNLLSNAIKYTPEGGSVSVTMIADSLGATIAVADSGLGIPSEEQALLSGR
jgi:signal transduction histidine kinase